MITIETLFKIILLGVVFGLLFWAVVKFLMGATSI
jgi:hypothetical protein